MKRALLLAVFIAICLPSCGKVADPGARERELSFLRCVMPKTLLEFAHVEVPAIENIAIQGEGEQQYVGLHLFAGQKKINRGVRAEIRVDSPPVSRRRADSQSGMGIFLKNASV